MMMQLPKVLKQDQSKNKTHSECPAKINELTAPEVFWLWCIHYWNESRKQKLDPIPMLSRAFSEVSITRYSEEDLAPQFDYSLSLLQDFSTKPLSVGRRYYCASSCSMEQIILGCMALTQSEPNPTRVTTILLKSFLPELVANTVYEILNDISKSSLKTGMILPVRENYLDLFRGYSGVHCRSSSNGKMIN